MLRIAITLSAVIATFGQTACQVDIAGAQSELKCVFPIAFSFVDESTFNPITAQVLLRLLFTRLKWHRRTVASISTPRCEGVPYKIHPALKH